MTHTCTVEVWSPFVSVGPPSVVVVMLMLASHLANALRMHVFALLLPHISPAPPAIPLFLALKFLIVVRVCPTILCLRGMVLFDCTPGLVVLSGCTLEGVIIVVGLGEVSVLLVPVELVMSPPLAPLALVVGWPSMFMIVLAPFAFVIGLTPLRLAMLEIAVYRVVLLVMFAMLALVMVTTVSTLVTAPIPIVQDFSAGDVCADFDDDDFLSCCSSVDNSFDNPSELDCASVFPSEHIVDTLGDAPVMDSLDTLAGASQVHFPL